MTALAVLVALLCATPIVVSSSPAAGASSRSSSVAGAALSTELATLASEGDALRLWQRATASAADAVVDALRRQDTAHNVQLKDIELDVRLGGREDGGGAAHGRRPA